MERKKCEECNKKIKSIISYPCKCQRYFCQIHKISKLHNCNYDYISEYKKILQNNNQRVKKDKINKI